MNLYNSLTRKKEKFTPLKKKLVTLYSCGPTVYNYAHLGNLRTFLLTDFLKRTLILNGYQVRHVMNITDVGHLATDADSGEDKIEKGAKRENKTVWQIAKFYTKEFKKDIRALNITPPDTWSKATDHIKDQINLIKKLEKNGFVYEGPKAVYFNTQKFPDYGKIINLKNKKARTGAGRREGKQVEIDPNKKNPKDFVLWFKRVGKYKNHAMHWDSPWGDGFPGWHIECSAMSMKYLGPTIDIHTGGIDLLSAHHINEIAQSENATGRQFVRHWIHGEFLTIGDEIKMAKSDKNFLRLQSIIDKKIHPLSYRYLTLTAHYRSKLNFTWKALGAANTALKKLHKIMGAESLNSKSSHANTEKYERNFQNALNDDLNLPKALVETWNVAKSALPLKTKKRLLKKFDKVLGLNLKSAKINKEIKKIAKERELLRVNKQFIKADALRKKIESLGYEIEDMDHGICLKPTSNSLLKT